jgi:hypothetical protein
MRLTILLLSLIIHTGLFAQTTYNVFTYAEPKGYKKEVKSGFISYTKTDNKAGTYCIISLYAQSPSSGDLVKDFDNDWKELVATPLGVTTAPEKDNGDEITGWKTNSGGANFTFSGGTSMALLTTAKMDNANVAILVVTNAQSLLTTDVDTFFDKIKLAKPKAMVVKPISIQKNIVSSNPNDIPTVLTGKYQNGTGALSDYKFIVPASFTGTIYTDEIQFKDTKTYSGAVVSILPLVAYNGNIETDLLTIFFQQFKDWQPHTLGGFDANGGEFEKGFTAQGFPYIKANKMLTKSNSDYGAAKTDGLILLIKVGNKLATIVAADNFQSISGQADKVLNYLIFTLRFNNAPATSYSLQNDMLNSWSSASGSVGLSNSYYKNGTFDFGGASRIYVNHDANYDKVTTTSYGTSGTYSLKGNELTSNFKSNNNTTKELVRVYYKKFNTDAWVLKMQTLDPNSKCNEPCVPKGVEYNKTNY